MTKTANYFWGILHGNVTKRFGLTSSIDPAATS